jgi:hypothetical protein
LIPHPTSLSSDQRERKAEAIRCYAGELPKLERGIGDWQGFGPLAAPEHLEFELFWLPDARQLTDRLCGRRWLSRVRARRHDYLSASSRS